MPTEFMVPESFGAVGNGSTDDTTALNNFLTALQTSGLEGRLSGRTYRVTSGLTISAPVKLSGCGPASVINNTNTGLATGILNVTAAGASGMVLQDFMLNSSVIASGSTGLVIQGTPLPFKVQGVWVNGTGGGIFVSASQPGSWMDKCNVSNVTSNSGYHIDAGNMVVTDCYSGNTAKHGYLFTSSSGGSAGLIVKGCTSYYAGSAGNGQGNGFYFSGNSTYNIGALLVANCVASEVAGGSGFLFDTHGANMGLANCYVELAGFNPSTVIITPNASSFLFTPNNSGVMITNPNATFGTGHGIEMQCSNFSIVGGFISQVNQSNASSGSSIVVGTNGAVAAWNITGVNTSFVGAQNFQKYGVNIYSNSASGVVAGCVLQGTTAAYYNSGSASLFGYNISLPT